MCRSICIGFRRIQLRNRLYSPPLTNSGHSIAQTQTHSKSTDCNSRHQLSGRYCLWSCWQAIASDNMACSCTGYGAGAKCGNQGVGGDNGDIFTDLSKTTVDAWFVPNPLTGWTCVVPSNVRGIGGPLGCFCADHCTKIGDVSAGSNAFDLGLSQSTVDADYGGGKPGNKTGWLCGNYRIWHAEKAEGISPR